MNLTKSLFIIFFLFVFTLNSNAKELKIAVIDIQKVEQKSEIVEKFTKNLDKKYKKYQDEIKKMEEDITKDSESLKKKSSALSSEKIKEEEKKIQIKIDEYTKKTAKINAIFDEVKNYALVDLNKCMSKIVEKISNEKELSLVMPNNAVIFYSNDLFDITDISIKEMDKSSCKIDIDQYFKKAEQKK